MVGRLTEGEIEALLSSASMPEQAARRLGRSVAEAALSEEEREVAEALLRRLVAEASLKVREAIADTLQASPHLPHDIAAQLIADAESVAVPVLRHSPVVTPADLIKVIQAGGTAQQIAVAGRHEVPAEVAEALVGTDNNQAVATLVGNPGAALDAALLERVAGKFGADGTIGELLRGHPRLSSHVAERLRHFGATALVEYLSRHPELPEAVTTPMVLRTLDEISLGITAERPGGHHLEGLVSYLCKAGRLTPSLILRSLCTGDVDLYEASLAKLAGVPVENARVLIHDAGPLGPKSLHDKAGVPARFLPALRIALEILRETLAEGREWDRRGFQRAVLERILSDPEHLDEADAEYLLIRLNTARGSTAA